MTRRLSSLMGFGPNTNALAIRVVDGFLHSRCPSCSLLTYWSTHKDRVGKGGGGGNKGASYPPDSSFIGFLRYFMEVAAPPACSASPSAAIASWSATTYLIGYAVFVANLYIYRIFHNPPPVDALSLGWSPQSRPGKNPSHAGFELRIFCSRGGHLNH